MAVESLRRSTRARKPVQSYAAEQAENEDDAVKTKTASKGKKKRTIKEVDVYDGDDAYTNTIEVAASSPAKKPKKKTKKSAEYDDDDVREDGSIKKGLSLFFAGHDVAPEGSSWHADAAERRIASSKRQISKLAQGQEETRLRPFVEDAEETYRKALKKANSQRMFVLNRDRAVETNCHANHDDCPMETLEIAGSTGNVYTVTISHTPTCTCPVGIFKNKSKETLCKHALYILHNVLKVPEHLKQQNAFLTSELKEIFANAPPLPSTLAESNIEAPAEGRKAIEGDCPICFMEFEDGEEIVWCRAACGNNIHKGCFEQWAGTKGDRVTCPFCRSAWEKEVPKAKKVDVASVSIPEARGKSGYRNVRDQLDYGD